MWIINYRESVSKKKKINNNNNNYKESNYSRRKIMHGLRVHPECVKSVLLHLKHGWQFK